MRPVAAVALAWLLALAPSGARAGWPEVNFPSEPGITLVKGQTYTISWSSVRLNPVPIYLVKNVSETTIKLVKVLAPAYSNPNYSGTYSWTVPYDIPNGSSYVIQVGVLGQMVAFSDNPFTITGGDPPAPTRIIGMSGDLAFGTQRAATTTERVLTIHNTGNASLNVTGITYPAGFWGAWKGSIPAGGSQAVTVTFAPGAAIAYTGTVIVASDATDGTSALPVSGTGIWPPPVTNAFTQVGGVAVVLAGAPSAFRAPEFEPGWAPLTCAWDFGDGSTSTDCAPAHVFTNCQTFTVSYSGSDGVTGHATNLPVVVPCELGVTNSGAKVQAKLNFAVPAGDSFSLTAFADLGAGFNVSNQAVVVSFGGAEVAFVLDAKGKGISYPNACSLKYNAKTSLWMLKVKCKAGHWRGSWAAFEMTDDTVAKPGRPVTVPVVVLIGDGAFAAEKTLVYTAAMGKSGSAK